jgi:hypothetical protein
MRKIALNPKKAVIKGLFVMRTKRYALFIFRAYPKKDNNYSRIK